MGWEGQTWLSWVNVKIKMVIIIILKHDSRIDSEQDPSYRLWGLIWVDLGHHKDKNSYYYSFKTWLEGQPDARLESWVGRVNLNSPK